MEQNIQQQLAVAQKYLKEDQVEQSLRELKKILAVDPDNAQAHLCLSSALERKGTADKERAFYVLALNEAKLALKHQRGENKEIHQQIINLYQKSGQLDTAIIEYKKYLAQDPHNRLYQDCLKQITMLSIFQATTTSADQPEDNKLIWWMVLFFVIGVLILLVLYGIFKYLQIRPSS